MSDSETRENGPDMPAGIMASPDQEQGGLTGAMPSGEMPSGVATESAMPDGRPGSQGEMPTATKADAGSSLPANEMPVGLMAQSRGVDGDGSGSQMPVGAMDMESTFDAPATKKPARLTPPALDLSGTWHLVISTAQVTED